MIEFIQGAKRKRQGNRIYKERINRIKDYSNQLAIGIYFLDLKIERTSNLHESASCKRFQ